MFDKPECFSERPLLVLGFVFVIVFVLVLTIALVLVLYIDTIICYVHYSKLIFGFEDKF